MINDENRWDEIAQSLVVYNLNGAFIEQTYKNCLLKYEDNYYSGELIC